MARYSAAIKNTTLTTSIMLASTAYALFSQHTWLCVIGGACLAIIVSTLWIQYIPPVLTYLFFYHWIQVFAGIMYSDYLGQPFDVMYGNTANTEMLYAATFIQISIMAVILSRMLKIDAVASLEHLREQADKLDVKKIMTAYFIASLIFPTLIAVTYSNSSLNQLVGSFSVIRKVLFMMLIFILFLKKTPYRNAIIIIIFAEFLLSFVSFFSDFKEVIFYLIATYFTINPKIETKLIVRTVPVFALLVVFLTFWSNVKDDYRAFLNKGSRQQNVSAGTFEALSFLLDKAGEFNIDSANTGSEILLHRMQYMEQYSTVYGRVPSIIEHTNGSNLFSTLKFLLVPRAIDADKKKLDPSTKTSYYTGKAFANAEMGTSISMGYFCDLYIDYGLLAMIIPLIMITYLIGKASNYILGNTKYNQLFTYALFMGVTMNLGTFESDIIYYVGMIRNFIVFMIVGNAMLFPYLNKYLTKQRV